MVYIVYNGSQFTRVWIWRYSTIFLKLFCFCSFSEDLKSKSNILNKLWTVLSPNKLLFCFSFLYNVLACRTSKIIWVEIGYQAFTSAFLSHVSNDHSVSYNTIMGNIFEAFSSFLSRQKTPLLTALLQKPKTVWKYWLTDFLIQAHIFSSHVEDSAKAFWCNNRWHSHVCTHKKAVRGGGWLSLLGSSLQIEQFQTIPRLINATSYLGKIFRLNEFTSKLLLPPGVHRTQELVWKHGRFN